MNHATHGRRYCRSASRMKSATRDRDSGWQTVRRATDARSTDSGRAPAMKPVTDDGWRRGSSSTPFATASSRRVTASFQRSLTRQSLRVRDARPRWP